MISVIKDILLQISFSPTTKGDMCDSAAEIMHKTESTEYTALFMRKGLE